MSELREQLQATLGDAYTIERELGGGGMSRVFVARDRSLGREVVVKVLPPEMAARVSAERFTREIAIAARLQHPHIVQLFSAGEAGELRWFTMPFVAGESLRAKLARGDHIPLADAVRILREVASALAYAHANEVVHRDIKPDNVLLSGGAAMVTDFGVAKAIDPAYDSRERTSGSLTSVGMALGTPAYMAPEQIAADREADHRVDLYAWGIMAYELLAGAPPFAARAPQAMLAAHIAEVPEPLAKRRSGLPAGLSDLVMRCLAKAPSDRPRNATEIVAALDGLSLSDESRALRVPVVRSRAARVVATTVVAFVLVVAWRGWRNPKRDVALDPNVIAVLPFRVGGDPAVAYLRESMLDLLQARLSGGAGARTVEPRTLLAAWRRAAGSGGLDLSEQASRALATELGAGRVLLGSAIATPTELTLSGSLIRVGDGAVLARESVAGAPDSIAALVNRLTSALLIRDAGESGERRVGLAAAPLGALQDYLAGRTAYRRGDYFAAMSLYGRALERDSTFVEAAFGMVATNAWIGTVFTTAGYRAIPSVWRMRDRLGPRDLGLFLAMPMVGPDYPRPSDYAAIIAQAERAASQASDSPEHWLLLGQLLTSYGAAASRRDWHAQAVDALDRAVALDSSFSTALGARLYTALSNRDQPTTVRVAGLLESRVAAGFTDDFLLWAAARARGDSAAALRWRDRTEGLSRTDFMQKLVKISLFSVQLGLPMADARWVPGRLRRDAATEQERGGMLLADFAVRFAEGRTGLVDQPERYGPGWVASIAQQALIEPAYRAIATGVLAAEAGGRYRMILRSGGEMRWPPVQLCLGTLLRSAAGDTTGIGAAIAGLREFAVLEPPPLPRTEWEQIEMDVCPRLLDVLRETPPKAGVRWVHLEELDSIMQRGPRAFSGATGISPTAFANFTIARLREARGEVPAALAAIRRRESDGFPGYLWSRAAFLRQEGRLAALAADTAGATRAYDAYLVLRSDPDPALRAQRDSVVAERAAMMRHAGTPSRIPSAS